MLLPVTMKVPWDSQQNNKQIGFHNLLILSHIPNVLLLIPLPSPSIEKLENIYVESQNLILLPYESEHIRRWRWSNSAYYGAESMLFGSCTSVPAVKIFLIYYMLGHLLTTVLFFHDITLLPDTGENVLQIN
jgi:hypothetical protein